MLKSEIQSIWITSDGKKFLCEKEANMHEIELSTKDIMEEWLRHKEEYIITTKQKIKEKIEWLKKQQQSLK